MDELSEFSFVWSEKKKLLGYWVVVENVVGGNDGIGSGIWSGIGSGIGSRGSGSGSGSKRFPNPERAWRMVRWWRRMGLRRMRKD